MTTTTAAPTETLPEAGDGLCHHPWALERSGGYVLSHMCVLDEGHTGSHVCLCLTAEDVAD